MWNETGGEGFYNRVITKCISKGGVIWAKTQWIRMNQKMQKDGENILGNDSA